MHVPSCGWDVSRSETKQNCWRQCNDGFKVRKWKDKDLHCADSPSDGFQPAGAVVHSERTNHRHLLWSCAATDPLWKKMSLAIPDACEKECQRTELGSAKQCLRFVLISQYDIWWWITQEGKEQSSALWIQNYCKNNSTSLSIIKVRVRQRWTHSIDLRLL